MQKNSNVNSSQKTENTTPTKTSYRFKKGNRRFHIIIGLYFLLFIWLFSISGLLLNNPEWSISQFWPDRKETSFQKQITPPKDTGDLAVTRDLMNQLEIRGEIHETKWGPSRDEFSVQIRRPGQMLTIEADFASGLATVEETRVNASGVIRMLHLFIGSKSEYGRNWIMAKIWAFSMDALAAGIIILVISGLYMWFHLNKKFITGLSFLAFGIVMCLFFLFGLAFL